MKKEEITINDKYHQLLISASLDKNLTGNQFRVLFYISVNDEILVSRMQKDLNFKTTNLMSNSIKQLIKQGYIKRHKTKKKVIKNTPFYVYELNTEKALELNLNKLVSDNYFDPIDTIYNYFFEILPTTFKIDKSRNYKAVELLIYKDEVDTELIKKVIDFISISKFRRTVKRPIALRKYFDLLLKELSEQ